MRISLLFNIFVIFVVVVYARNPKDKYGILYVNEILANIDTFTVQIEDNFVQENVLTLDIIEEWTGTGIFAEGITFDDGNVILADDFLVNPDTTFPGELYANGGIFADAGKFADPVHDFYSFVVADDSGDTNFGGTLFATNGIFSNSNAFTVAAGSGDTTVRDAKFNANSGLSVNGGSFVGFPNGDLYIDSSLHVVGTIIIGTSETEERFISRVSSPSQIGGDTFFAAQDGTGSGGDLYIVPGWESDCTDSCDDGSIFVGSIANGNIRIKRADVSGDGLKTSYHGQDSPNGDGGDIVLQGGDSAAKGDGGDIILVPGLSSIGNHGSIFLGTNEAGISDFDLTIQRPDLASGNGGDTFISGQNTENGNAGNLNILAGQGPNGGILYLVPGDANQDTGVLEEQGDIVLGNDESAALVITRSESNTSGGDTLIAGQESDLNDGGELFLKAGSSEGNGNGGSLHLLPGSFSGSVTSGTIIVGDQVTNLSIQRESRDGGGLDTYILGQDGAASQGGDLFFTSGDGATTGGDLFIGGGASNDNNNLAFAVGGGVIIEGGDGQIDGGNIHFGAGNDPSLTNSGNIIIGTNTAVVSNNIYFNGGSGTTLGDVSVAGNGSTLILDNTPIVIENSYFEIQEGSERVIFRADPMNILEYNGKTLLRKVSDYPVPSVRTDPISNISDAALTETTMRLAQLQNSLEILVNTLGQCQHGLFETLNQFGIPDSCDAFIIN